MIRTDRLGEAVHTYIEKLVLASEPEHPLWNRENFIFNKPVKWNYIDNCMIRALIMLYEHSGDERLAYYAQTFMDSYVLPNGEIPTLKPADMNIDNFNGGRNLIWLHRKTGDEKYRLAYERLFGMLSVQPRLSCGNYWHKAIYPHQMWLDGAYMALPFETKYAAVTHCERLFDDVERQLSNFRQFMRDERTGLYYHGYDESGSQRWADKVTGHSGEFWLRSMGWLCAGLADICEIAPTETHLHELSGEMLCELTEALAATANPDGTLNQLPAYKDLEGNYPETSGTLLFAYSAMKAYRLGQADEKMFAAGQCALESVAEKYIVKNEDGFPVLKNICLMAGLGGTPYRDGSAEYYLNERITENDAKGIAPYLMAYTELIRN